MVKPGMFLNRIKTLVRQNIWHKFGILAGPLFGSLVRRQPMHALYIVIKLFVNA